MPRKRNERVKKKCKNCGKSFFLQKSWQKFCKPDCRKDWHCERVMLAKEALEEKEAREN